MRHRVATRLVGIAGWLLDRAYARYVRWEKYGGSRFPELVWLRLGRLIGMRCLRVAYRIAPVSAADAMADIGWWG